MKVLFIDDSLDSLNLYKIYLRKLEDVDTLCVDSGKAGLASMSEVDYDIIFLDIQMPEMDGFEVFDNILKLNLKAKVYALTGFSDADSIEAISKKGFTGHLIKPVLKGDIIKVITDGM